MSPTTDELARYLEYFRIQYAELGEELARKEAQLKKKQARLEQLRKALRANVPVNEIKMPTSPSPPDSPLIDIVGYALQPLGYILSDFRKRFEAPRQPFLAHASGSFSELVLTHQETATHIIEEVRQRLTSSTQPLYALLHVHFDRNHTFRCSTMPPRQSRRVGLFSTRTPHRVNPIGQSLVRVVSIEEEHLILQGGDLLVGTPVLAFQLYDRHDYPDVSFGWLQDEPLYPLYYDTQEGGNVWIVDIAPHVEERLRLLQSITVVNLRDLVISRLSTVPLLTRTHKTKTSDREQQLAISAYRVCFTVDGTHVQVTDLIPALSRDQAEKLRDIDPECRELCTFYESL